MEITKEQVLPVALFLKSLTHEQPPVPSFAPVPHHTHPTAQDKDGGKKILQLGHGTARPAVAVRAPVLVPGRG